MQRTVKLLDGCTAGSYCRSGRYPFILFVSTVLFLCVCDVRAKVAAKASPVSLKGRVTCRKEIFTIQHDLRNCSVRHFCRRLLFTGCGYSGTGFLSQVFRRANINIGHESLYRSDDGLSDWRRAVFQNSGNFSRVFCQYRHPYSVLFSARSTQWDFTIDVSDIVGAPKKFHISSTLRPSQRRYWPHLSHDFKTLLWWVVYTKAARRKCMCSWHLEHVSRTLLFDVCLLASFEERKCSAFKAIKLLKNVNQHRSNITDTSPPSIGNVPELIVWSQMVALAEELGYFNFPLLKRNSKRKVPDRSLSNELSLELVV